MHMHMYMCMHSYVTRLQLHVLAELVDARPDPSSPKSNS